MQKLSPANIKKIIVDTLKENKAEDTSALNIKKLTDIADYMVIATANSNVHVKALINKVREKLVPLHIKPIGIEDGKTSEWMLIDYGNVIVHVMLERVRKFYDLEKLWDIRVPTKSSKKPDTKKTMATSKTTKQEENH